MHDIQRIRENPSKFDEEILKRGIGPVSDNILKLDKEKRKLTTHIQDLQNERRLLSDEIGIKKSESPDSDVTDIINKVHNLKENIVIINNQILEIDQELKNILLTLPNLPEEDVPIGEDEKFNIELEDHRFKIPENKFTKQHFELSGIDSLMDFETAAKVSGSRFVFLKGQIAMLERALGQFMLDTHIIDNGLIEISPPIIVNNNSMLGTAQLPKFEEDQFQVIVHHHEKTNIKNRKWLIPTAEVSLTNIVRERITEKKELPLRYVALTPCFRAEAGAAGRDTRGMIRQHQFQKVEMVSITEPEMSSQEHERMLTCAENILKKLDLPYRVMVLSTGDMGFSARKTYDLEVWLPGQNSYREISSISNCGDFQARRMMARYKFNQKDIRYLHTLNGSGVAVGRAMIAVLENYQTHEGIVVPDVLKKYMNNINLIKL
ncbi:MAG: serine--tRNA ligase [Hyphomicrobiales bacterium]|jgi:seryl-tRNA synthetase|nr:serine--tRNA ligase [Hyphomicrobiales bacterium]